MGNKDEKTFTDLFSSSKEQVELKSQSFSEILNSSIEQTNASSTNITFDSLFEQVPSKEENKDTKVEKIENLDKQRYEKEKTDFNSLFENNDTINEKGSIDNKENIEKNNLKEVVLENKEIENNKIEETNIFLDTTNNSAIDFNEPEITTSNEGLNELSNNTDFNLFINSNNNVEENNIVEKEENKVEQIKINTNPFFEGNAKNEEITIENNPFFKEDINKSNINDFSSNGNNIDTTNNPFMNSNNSVEENKVEVNKINTNPFFEEKETNEEESIIDIMPIFKVEKDKEISIESNPFFKEETNQPSILLDINKETKEIENIQPKSFSPFFEEENKTEENPFFQNQLNLVENKIPDNPKGTIDSSKSKHYNVKIVKKKEPLIKLVLGVLSYALFIWLLLIGITLLVYVLDIKIRAAKGDYSSPTFNAYVVLTGSMLPEIEVFDVVVTKKVDAKNLKEGDVITFASADTRFLDTIITHRIIKKNPPSNNEGYTFQTQGDNNNVADSALVPENRIFGKVILKIPKLGYLQEFLASRGGWIIVILIPCLTVMSYDIVKLIKALKRKKYKNIKVQK